MSRLSLLALALLTLPAASTRAAIVFHPSPVPSSECAAPTQLASYYQRQLQVLNYPYRTVYAPTQMPDYSYPRPTVDMLQTPCEEAPLYYRKADLLPPEVTYRRA